MEQPAPELIVKWNDLDAVSDEVRAKIFQTVADGGSKLISSAAVSKEWLHKFLTEMYPKFTEDDVQDYITGISGMAKHKQFLDASYTEVLDFNNDDQDADFDLPDGDNE